MYYLNLYNPISGNSYYEFHRSTYKDATLYLDVNHVQSIRATDFEFDVIIEELENIPKPNFMRSNCGRDFTWFGDTAKSIHAYLISKANV
jgi:hypothetical protein